MKISFSRFRSDIKLVILFFCYGLFYIFSTFTIFSYLEILFTDAFLLTFLHDEIIMGMINIFITSNMIIKTKDIHCPRK